MEPHHPVAFATYDLATRTPAMKVMKWGWALVVLYTGPIGLFVYLVSCREPLVEFLGATGTDGLLQWLRTAARPPERVVVDLGDLEPAAAPAERIRRDLGWHARVPEYRERVTLELLGYRQELDLARGILCVTCASVTGGAARRALRGGVSCT